MGLLAIGALIAAQLAFGLAAMSFVPAAALRSMRLAEKLASGLLLGICAPAFLALLLLFAGAPLSGWWWAGAGGAGLVCLALRPRALAPLLASPAKGPALCQPPALGLLFGAAALALFSWTLMASLFLPTTDFDGLAIWSFRVKVLLNERSLYSETFTDPARFTPMPRHPYFLPVMEAAYALAWGRFSYAAIHLPQTLFYLCYLGLAWGAAKTFEGGWRAMGLAASLLLLPAMAVQPHLDGAREPMIGVLGLAAVWYLARWADDPLPAWLLLGAVFALAAQQIKIEGLPLALGYALAAAALSASRRDDATRLPRLRQTAFAVLLMLLSAAPWYLVRNNALPATHGYAFASGFDASLAQRLSALPRVGCLLFSELFFRPELYGAAPVAMVAALLTGWRRGRILRRLAPLAPALLCMAAILAIYAVRQDQLAPERNVTFSRRVACFLPALILASFWLPRSQKDERE